MASACACCYFPKKLWVILECRIEYRIAIGGIESPMLRLPSTAICTLFCLATLAASGCKKEPTTNPDEGADAATDDADGSMDDGAEVDAPAEPEEEAPSVLSKDSFDSTINDNMDAVLECYMSALEGNAELAGELKAVFTFGADGSVSVAAAEGSTLSDEGLTACIAEAAGGWGFDAPSKDGMTMEYPFNLAPAE